ncbi:hypothetical protein Vadar_012750 [Vaccinium darrowii]|uniref:Uncharacterized protein n=1 Tax=Vaccinium darrowii TaxID=229202 RepID=A0ACB7XQE1_9ERIC|nr:hypothetical protein Vadar_012750 [Vaccinium darrowii]
MRRKESKRISEELVMVASDRSRITERQNGFKPMGRSHSRGGESRVVDKRKCYFCNKEMTHNQFCPKLKARIDEEKEKSKAVVVESFVENKGDLLTVTLEGTENFDWVMDSSCSFHMSSNKKYFCSYEACDGSTVRMTNHMVNKVVDIGTVICADTVGRTIKDRKG